MNAEKISRSEAATWFIYFGRHGRLCQYKLPFGSSKHLSKKLSFKNSSNLWLVYCIKVIS